MYCHKKKAQFPLTSSKTSNQLLQKHTHTENSLGGNFKGLFCPKANELFSHNLYLSFYVLKNKLRKGMLSPWQHFNSVNESQN